jgi:hypothetical protein
MKADGSFRTICQRWLPGQECTLALTAPAP